MTRSERYQMSEKQKWFEKRKSNKINKRHNSPAGKRKGVGVWFKTRRRVRRSLLSR